MTEITTKQVSASNSGSRTAKPERPVQITVKRGDTLYSIAQKFGMKPEELKTWLDLKSNNLSIGQKIDIPNDTVPEGKGILALARKYNMSLEEFGKLNNLPKPYKDYTAAKGERFYVKKKPASGNAEQISSQPKKKESKTTSNTAAAGADRASKSSAVSQNTSKPIGYKPDELAAKIYEGSGKIAAVGRPDFDALIAAINPKNVTEVIDAYTKNPANRGKESLINTITSEIRSDKEKRKEAVMHIYDALAKRYGTPAAVREGFVQELDKQFASVGMVNTKKLDETINRMMASPQQIAEKMEKDIDDKFSAVGKASFNELLALVTPKNAAEVITAYDKLNTGESLIEGITSEIGSSKEARKKAVMHIYDALAAQKNTPASQRELFEKELNEEFDSWGMVNTEKMDEMINTMLKSASASELAKIEGTPQERARKITLGNGEVHTAESLRKGAIESAKKDVGFAKVKKPYIVRPLPYVNSEGKIEAASEIHRPTDNSPNAPLKGKVVIVNAGHGGYNPKNGYFDAGTVLSVKNAEGKEMPIEEWRVASSYTEDLTQKLQAKGATVVVVSGPVKNGTGGMYETKYLENLLQGNRGSEEIKELFKNTQKSDMAFISIHVESAKEKPSAKCCTVRANHDSGDKVLAEKVQQHVGETISVLKPEIKTNDYYVTRAMGPEIPAVLVELGNIANKEITASLLSSTDRNKYTTALAEALEETLLKK